MANGLPILTLLTFLPTIGALIIALISSVRKSTINNDRLLMFALWVSVFTFIVSVLVYFQLDLSTADFQLREKVELFKDSGIYYHLGVDGISIYLVLLTTLLTPVCILVSWDSIKVRLKEYLVLFLVLETLVIGVFLSLDFMLFYLFFEASLIPMYLIIGIWGGENRIYASYKFFLYTLLGSLFLLLAIIYLYIQFGTTDIPTLYTLSSKLDLGVQKILWLAFFASFAVKVPMFPFHTWLPDAHVQAPTAGSVVLAGVLLKLGAYGFIRFSLPMLPAATIEFSSFVYVLSIIAVIYTSLVALAQEDMKKMIAYSSIAHMGYVTAGIFALNHQALDGAVFQMLSHGIVSAALFVCVGVLYERMHTKKIDAFGGIVSVMPKFAMLFMVFTMASVGLPGTSGFVGEFLVILGVYKSNIYAAAGVATGIVLGATYMLLLYRKVVYGEINNPEIANLKDINSKEKICLYTLAILAILYGVSPWLITEGTNASITEIIKMVK